MTRKGPARTWTKEGNAAVPFQEREIHEQGLVGVLKELHDELDTIALLNLP